MDILREFYEIAIDCLKSNNSKCNKGCVYITKFTNKETILCVDKIEDLYNGTVIKFYDKITNTLSRYVSEKKDIFYICDSSDIEEDIIHGDYSYYYGMISNDIGFIYMNPSHEIIPARVTFYGPQYQLEVNGDNNIVEMGIVNISIYNIFFLSDPDKRRKQFFEILKNYDRPLLDPKFG